VLAGFPPTEVEMPEMETIDTRFKSNESLLLRLTEDPNQPTKMTKNSKKGPHSADFKVPKPKASAATKKAPLAGVHSLADFQTQPKKDRHPQPMHDEDEDGPDYVPPGSQLPPSLGPWDDLRRSLRKRKPQPILITDPSPEPSPKRPKPNAKPTAPARSAVNPIHSIHSLNTTPKSNASKTKTNTKTKDQLAKDKASKEISASDVDANPDMIGQALFEGKDQSQIDNLSMDDAKATLSQLMSHAALLEEHQQGDGQLNHMREAFRVGLQLEMETTKGISRFESALNKSFTMTRKKRASGAGHELHVTFKHQNELIEESVEFYSKAQLTAIIMFVVLSQGDKGKEAMRPLKMATASPRTFWCLIHFFGDVTLGLTTLLPRTDWYERSRQLHKLTCETTLMIPYVAASSKQAILLF